MDPEIPPAEAHIIRPGHVHTDASVQAWPSNCFIPAWLVKRAKVVKPGQVVVSKVEVVIITDCGF